MPVIVNRGGMVDKSNLNTSSMTVRKSLCKAEAKWLLKKKKKGERNNIL